MMINKEVFLNEISRDNPDFNLDLIAKAYTFCEEAHAGQVRKSGEPYVIHPISVALEVSRLQIDEVSIIASLLHDVVEDTKYTREDIVKEFGNEVATIIDGVTKLEKIQFKEKQRKQVEDFRKLFLAISKDVRVLIIKLCDRVHNMETIEFQSPEKQQSIALETIEIYAPMAERIGLQKIKNKLQDMSFKILHPVEYAEITKKVQRLKDDFNSTNLVEEIISELIATLQRNGIEANERTVFGREKLPYSIWLKMTRKNIPFEEITDVLAFRIIVKTKEECYRALGAIHTTYNAIPGKFKDFISIPKSNGYRSLHTKIMGWRGHQIDIQIRTQEMHDENEFGLASHWKYKQGMTREDKIKYLRATWINRVLDILSKSETKDILKDAKVEISEQRVIAFTDKGDVVDLPYKSSVLDFAFAIDEKLGLYFDYAIVNGQHCGISYILQNGDKVSIYTTNKPVVNSIWLNYVITGKARNCVIEYLSSQR